MQSFWRIWKVVRVATIFTLFYVGGAFSGLFVLPPIWLSSTKTATRIRRTQAYITLSFRIIVDAMRLARIFSYDWRDVSTNLPEGPSILVANHPTTIDVVTVTAVYPQLVIVVKHKIWTNPLLRWVFRWCGHVDGGDGSLESNMRLAEQVKERIEEGYTVAIWPEGGRSPVGGLQKMQKGAFALAAATGAPLVPLTIHCSPPVLHKEAPWYVWPTGVVDYHIDVGTPIASEGQTSRQLQREVEALYRDELGVAAAL